MRKITQSRLEEKIIDVFKYSRSSSNVQTNFKKLPRLTWLNLTYETQRFLRVFCLRTNWELFVPVFLLFFLHKWHFYCVRVLSIMEHYSRGSWIINVLDTHIIASCWKKISYYMCTINELEYSVRIRCQFFFSWTLQIRKLQSKKATKKKIHMRFRWKIIY